MPSPALQRNSSLAILPAELRLKIFSYLLLTPRIELSYLPYQRLRPQHLFLLEQFPKLNLHPAILLSCRLFHAEGTPILYSNSFSYGSVFTRLTDLHFEAPPESNNNASGIPRPIPQGVSLPFLSTITRIDQVPIDVPDPKTIMGQFTILESFPALRELYLGFQFTGTYGWEGVKATLDEYMDRVTVCKTMCEEQEKSGMQEMRVEKKDVFQHEISFNVIWIQK